jgi:DNA-binding SARP family transcriptional activator
VSVPNLRIRLLGGLQVVCDGAPVTTLSSPRLQALLAYLLLHRARPQPRRQVAFLLWTGSAESQARTNLRHLLHTLRCCLPHADRFIVVDETTIQWRGDAPLTLDVDEFENAVRRASSVQDWEQALTVYDGDLLPDCYDDWILPERERLRQSFVNALERLIALLESQRAYSKAIEYAQRRLHYDPLREEIYRTLMRLYALQGDRAGALRTFHECATVLQRELEVEPSPATREEYERLLHLEAPPPLSPPAAPPLVGRAGEWEQLQAIWRVAKNGQPQWVLISGEAGIGKTRLTEEFLHWIARQGITSVSARVSRPVACVRAGRRAAARRPTPTARPNLAHRTRATFARACARASRSFRNLSTR